MTVTDLDGNRFYDLTGSYGVNVFGYDFYKECIDARRRARARSWARCSAPTIRSPRYNVRRLKEISGLDEVSFHMSGTEAVMQAVRLARYHTRRKHLVRFCGAYHGWWGDVQPGVGNPRAGARDLHAEGHGRGRAHVLRNRRDIACVLVNPLQALHPERERAGRFDACRQRPHARTSTAPPTPSGCKQLREVCTERDIVLIFDEVFVGFRLAPGGAQEYFGVRADMVTYGKTARRRAARRRAVRHARTHEALPRRPAGRHLLRARHVQFASRMSWARCTNSCSGSTANPMRALYRGLDELWNSRAQRLNERLAAADLPVQVANLSSDLDAQLHAAVALQLDASILSARRRVWR